MVPITLSVSISSANDAVFIYGMKDDRTKLCPNIWRAPYSVDKIGPAIIQLIDPDGIRAAANGTIGSLFERLRSIQVADVLLSPHILP